MIDIVLGIILLLGIGRGLMNGFFMELASLLALIGGIYGAIHFSYLLKNFLLRFVSWDQKYIQLVAFAITFIIIVVLISLLGKLLTKFSSLIALGLVNRLLGAIFGFFKVLMVLSLILFFFGKISGDGFFVDQKTTETSVLYEPVKGFVPAILPAVLNWAEEMSWIEEKPTYFDTE